MNRDDLLARVAWFYYVEELTQQEIGERLNLSRLKVTRLLKKARDEGIVEFRIVKPTAHLALERDLRHTFALKDAFVVPTPLEKARLRDALGEAAAQFLQMRLRSGLVVGLGMGRTLGRIPAYMETLPKGGCTFVEMVGGAGGNEIGFDTYNVSWALAECCNGTAEHVFSPVVVDNPQVRAALLQNPQIASTLQLAARCDLALVGIGTVDDDMLMYRLGCCDLATVHDLQKRGAVGDILGHFFDINGHPLTYELEERLVALSLTQVRALPAVAAVAGGLDKVDAILGALHGYYANILITDMETAQTLLARKRQIESPAPQQGAHP